MLFLSFGSHLLLTCRVLFQEACLSSFRLLESSINVGRSQKYSILKHISFNGILASFTTHLL